jgi:ankyrin repeat protein
MATADTRFEETVYVTAAAQGDLTTIKNGLENEVNISTLLARMLCAAAYHGQPEIIKFPIARGADINANEDRETALLAAACGAQAEMTQLLIENGADVHVRRYNEGSALHESVRSYLPAKTNDTLEIINQLLAKGLEIEHRGEDGKYGTA